MKKSFKTLTALLSAITLISSLSPIMAMNDPSQEATSKCSLSLEKHRKKVIERLVTESYNSKIGFVRYDFDIIPESITPEEIADTTLEAQKNMQDIEAQDFSKVSSKLPTYEKFASAIIAYNLNFFGNLGDCKFLDYPGITCLSDTYSVPANGLLSHNSIIKILCIAEPEMSETFKADRMTVIYKNDSLVIRFYLNGKMVHESVLK